MQESIHAFKTIDEIIELEPILDHLTARPPLDLAYSDETEARLPDIVGGLSVALARAFKIIDPNLKNPATEHWRRSFQIFDLMLLLGARDTVERRRQRPGDGGFRPAAKIPKN